MTDTNAVTTSAIGQLDDLTENSMKLARVGDHRVVVVRTASGVYALDNACPHQGYGLATGALEGDVVTCQWHNWKFDVTNGVCTLGEEDVACHEVSIVDGEVSVTVRTPSADERRAALWPSLRRGIESDYVGQIARDSARLLAAGATPAEIVGAALDATGPKTDNGIGHEVAMAADALAMAEVLTGEEQTLPIVQGLSGLAEETRDRPAAELPSPDISVDFGAAVEAEDNTAAMAWVLGALQDDVPIDQVRAQFIDAVSQHHLGYGHGIIYTQKSFEVLDRVGWDKAPSILPFLARRIIYSTREDTLPYMRKAMRNIEAADLDEMASAPDRHTTGWSDDDLIQTLLSSNEAPIDEAIAAVHAGAGIGGLLDNLSLAASHRLLRHDIATELDHHEPIGWLDITHALTTARAARWAWQTEPGAAAARIALFATWLVFDSGRNERRRGTAHLPASATLDTYATQAGGTDLSEAIRDRNPTAAVSSALVGERADVTDRLARAAMLDSAGSFIVTAHLIKTAHAAGEEAATTESNLPLAAAARFLAAPRQERFVAASVAEANDFVRTGQPPRR